MSILWEGKEQQMRPIIEANIDVADDDQDTGKRFAYLAQYMEEGDGINVRANGYIIKTKVTGIEREVAQ